jgi:hypothetical protein
VGPDEVLQPVAAAMASSVAAQRQLVVAIAVAAVRSSREIGRHIIAAEDVIRSRVVASIASIRNDVVAQLGGRSIPGEQDSPGARAGDRAPSVVATS